MKSMPTVAAPHAMSDNRSTMSDVDRIREAIHARQSLRATYGGHLRDFSPHILGQTKGKWRVLAYQFAGFTSKGRVTSRGPANWRCFDVEGLQNLLALDAPWVDSSRKSGAQTCVEEIDVQARSGVTFPTR
jgi:hypothetical protein